MQYQKLGTSGIEVSKIAFGAWGLGGGNVWSDRSVSVREVEYLLDSAAELGINYVDTAPVYGIGTSEEILGEALKGRRDRFVVQTKCSLNWRNEGGQFEYTRDGRTVMRDHRASAIRKDVEDSLRRMKLDWIDSLVVHRISAVVPVEETMGELDRLIREGKIRTVLISNSKPADLAEYASYGDIAGVQEKFSMIAPAKQEYFETCRKYHALFQVYGSLEEGGLTGKAAYEKTYPEGDIRTTRIWYKEPARSAVLQLFDRMAPLCEKYGCSIANLVQAWTLRQYEGISLLTGFRRRETMEDTVKALDLHLSPEDAAWLDKAALETRARFE